MAGQLKYDATNTTAIKSADPKLTKAFAEGRLAQIAGSGTNPHASGSDANEAWQEGYETTTPEGLRDSCAEAIPVAVPDVVGMSEGDATDAIVAAGLLLGGVALEVGDVTVQDPAAATLVQPKSVVNITLTTSAVPDVVGMTEAEATAAIIAAGFALGTVTLDGGVVTVQSPLAGVQAVPGTDIDITLTTVEVPDVVGMTEVEATAAITGAGLTLGTVTLDGGVVTVQSPLAGAMVQPATDVDITLTTVKVPNVIGMSEVDATAAIIGAGLVLGTVTLMTGEVTIQDPVADTLVALESAVDITLTE